MEILHIQLEQLFNVMMPVSGIDAQLIHGDLAGNILSHSSLPFAVIDLWLYWRPQQFSAAIVIIDVVCFEGTDLS